MSETTKPAVLDAIQGMAADLAAMGIGKDGWNETQKFHFRGIDAVHDTFAPLLAKHKLFITPHVRERYTEIRARKDDKKDDLRFVVVKVDYTLLSTVDGSTIAAGPFFGEAMDSGDKATNKAMSIAYKYFAIETFSIPVVGAEGDPDGSGEGGLGDDRIIEIEKGFDAAPTKDALRGLLESALEEAKTADDHYAAKRFKGKAAARAEKMVDQPKGKSEKAAEGEKPAKPAEPAGKPSTGLIQSIRNVAKAKGLEGDTAILAAAERPEKALDDLDKPAAAAVLTALGKL